MIARLSCCLLLGSTLALPPAGAAEKVVRRTFPVGPGCRLKVDSYRGLIEVVEGDNPEIAVEARLTVGTDDEAKSARAFATVRLDIGSNGNEVDVVVRDPAQTAVRFDWQADERVDLVVHVIVPRACDTDTAIIGGNITVGNLKGAMSARARAGTIYLKRIDGPVRAEMDSGSIILSECTGCATLHARDGTIRTGPIGGGSVVRTGSGDIDVQHAPAGVVASAAGGSVTVGFPRGLAGDSRLATDGGNIFVKIDPGAACTIHAVSSMFGDVVSSLPLAVTSGGNGKSRLDATMNGGGPVIAIDASGGHVRIDSTITPMPMRRAQ